MPDEQNGVVEESQETKTTTEQTVESETPADEQSVEAEQTTGDEEFPEEPDKQREAFIKMRQELKALKSKPQPEVVEEQPQESVLNLFRKGPSYNPSPITEDTDLSQVTQRMTQAERIAFEADKRVRQLEQEREDERLYNAYPFLDPKHPESKTPKAKAMAKYIEGQYLVESLSNHKPDPVKLAQQAEELFSGLSTKQSEQAASDAIQKLRQKEEGSLEAKGRQPLVKPSADLDALRQRVRRGDMEALFEINKLTALKD